jgi:hypothetical protein
MGLANPVIFVPHKKKNATVGWTIASHPPPG